jgi:hypothetical protein
VVVPLKAQTVASSQLQLDSSMHGPVTVRTAGLRSQEMEVSLPKSLYSLTKSPEPNCLHPGHLEPKLERGRWGRKEEGRKR